MRGNTDADFLYDHDATTLLLQRLTRLHNYLFCTCITLDFHVWNCIVVYNVVLIAFYRLVSMELLSFFSFFLLFESLLFAPRRVRHGGHTSTHCKYFLGLMV